MKDLIERLEKLTGPEGEVDADIARHFGHAVVNMPLSGPHYEEDATPVLHYTASLDAALTLVPEGWFMDLSIDSSGTGWVVLTRPGGGFLSGEGEIERHGDAAIPAAALCIAALKAREARDG